MAISFLSRGFRQCVVVLILAVSLSLVAESSAAADSYDYGERSLLGWSESGATAYVLRQLWSRNSQASVVEVYRLGRRQPVRCFDLLSSRPDRAVACDQVRLRSRGRIDHAPSPPEVGSSRVSELETVPGRGVRADMLRLATTASATGLWLEVAVQLGDGFAELTRLRGLQPGTKSPVGPRHPFLVRAFPTPNGSGHTLLLVAGVQQRRWDTAAR